ncbi:MAG TPA: ribonuclease J [Clostridiaceae bacterium]|nr:ribonuclease J [Clostridiaceae bacterium]
MAKSKKKLKIIPLGGLQEIGKNITVFEYGDDIVVVDCGLAFPEDDMLGIDLVIPDVTYLEKNKEKVRGIVITHGHEDHIGALPYVLKDINVPVYGTRLTLGLLEYKLAEHKMLADVKLNTIKQGDTITLGCFKIEFIRSNHSIADSVALAIYTPVGTIVHTSDFKIDYTPIDGEPMDLKRLAEIGKEGVLLLMADSTNVERPGYTMSEKTVGATFEEIFMNSRGRILVATFASNVHRIQQVINSAVKSNRKVAVCGRSIVNVVNVAKELGYLTIPEGVFVDIDNIDKYSPDRVVIITTGSQGEPMAGLSRMAASDHRKVDIVPGDLVIISASPIPGNEKMIFKVINELFKKGAEVIYESLDEIHVSGHACQEELKLIHTLVKPKFFIPVHGEYRHLKRHANLANSLGMPLQNIFIMDNGNVLELTSDSAKMNGNVTAGKVLVDGLGVGDVGNIVLRDRKHLSQDGLIVVVITIDNETGAVIAGPDIISRGFVYVRESEDLMEQVKAIIKGSIEKFENKGKNDWSSKKSIIKDDLREFLYEKTKRNPMILPIIMEI